MISVIVVTRNQEDTIGRALDSVLMQRDAGEVEIIVGDDASSDGTEAVCRRYADRYRDTITYIRRDSNLGVAANYFDCIARSRGEYLADCAGDDHWTDSMKLSRQLEVLRKHQRTGMVLTDWVACDRDGGNVRRDARQPEVKERIHYDAGELLVSLFTQSVTPHLCTALYRREILEREMARAPELFIGPGLGCEDLQILATFAARSEVEVLPGVTLHYSVGSESVSSSGDAVRSFRFHSAVARQAWMLRRHFGVEEKDVARHLRQVSAHLAGLARLSGDAGVKRELLDLMEETGLPTGWKTRLRLWGIGMELLNLRRGMGKQGGAGN